MPTAQRKTPSWPISLKIAMPLLVTLNRGQRFTQHDIDAERLPHQSLEEKQSFKSIIITTYI